MERGLLWLPLLILFIGLAWSGWNEYRKVEMYRQWAEGFDRAKYDIYSVLGQKERSLTWGKPTRKGAIDLQTVSLDDVESVRLLVNDRPVDLDPAPASGSTAIELILRDRSTRKIPFTEIALAGQWAKFLQESIAENRGI
ncbi:hypothetical protein V0288_18925 [Pannus brasiliensis CCIBt3594]|uniref:Uncharacterized protein n=1 Tax=Pannus brasiliensis CCIBt3594 TaxID=1427578 RepID=A0AAW9QY12_9CHRO